MVEEADTTATSAMLEELGIDIRDVQLAPNGRRIWPETIKRRALELLDSGKVRALDLASAMGLATTQQMYAWRRQASMKGSGSPLPTLKRPKRSNPNYTQYRPAGWRAAAAKGSSRKVGRKAAAAKERTAPAARVEEGGESTTFTVDSVKIAIQVLARMRDHGGKVRITIL